MTKQVFYEFLYIQFESPTHIPRQNKLIKEPVAHAKYFFGLLVHDVFARRLQVELNNMLPAAKFCSQLLLKMQNPKAPSTLRLEIKLENLQCTLVTACVKQSTLSYTACRLVQLLWQSS